jgi:hypothetical protein
MSKQFNVDDMREYFSKHYPTVTMKTIQIEIRQQNENVRLYNLYVGYNNKPLQLHSMALTSKEDCRDLGFRIIEMNKGLIPQISWITY